MNGNGSAIMLPADTAQATLSFISQRRPRASVAVNIIYKYIVWHLFSLQLALFLSQHMTMKLARPEQSRAAVLPNTATPQQSLEVDTHRFSLTLLSTSFPQNKFLSHGKPR